MTGVQAWRGARRRVLCRGYLRKRQRLAGNGSRGKRRKKFSAIHDWFSFSIRLERSRARTTVLPNTLSCSLLLIVEPGGRVQLRQPRLRFDATVTRLVDLGGRFGRGKGPHTNEKSEQSESSERFVEGFEVVWVKFDISYMEWYPKGV